MRPPPSRVSSILRPELAPGSARTGHLIVHKSYQTGSLPRRPPTGRKDNRFVVNGLEPMKESEEKVEEMEKLTAELREELDLKGDSLKGSHPPRGDPGSNPPSLEDIPTPSGRPTVQAESLEG